MGSLGLLISPDCDVSVYFPNASYAEPISGVELVPIEGDGDRATIATPGSPHTCATNPRTGETVCIGLDSDVYLIRGSTLTATLTSGATASQITPLNLHGCQNCAVTVDPLRNRAIIGVGLAGGDIAGFQLLDLATRHFAPPVAAGVPVSTNILVDPVLNLVLSPHALDDYMLFDPARSSVSNYQRTMTDEYLIAAAEDCTTRIALSSVFGTGDILLADLTQVPELAVTPHLPLGPTWSPPTSVYVPNLATQAQRLSSGGIAVAPGTHVGLVASTFEEAFAAFRLPATSGSGTPELVDFVYAEFGLTPSGTTFDPIPAPHSITAYTSPRSGRPMAVVGSHERTYLAVVDIEALLAAPRNPGSNRIQGSVDLVATGILRFVSIH